MAPARTHLVLLAHDNGAAGIFVDPQAGAGVEARGAIGVVRVEGAVAGGGQSVVWRVNGGGGVRVVVLVGVFGAGWGEAPAPVVALEGASAWSLGLRGRWAQRKWLGDRKHLKVDPLSSNGIVLERKGRHGGWRWCEGRGQRGMGGRAESQAGSLTACEAYLYSANSP